MDALSRFAYEREDELWMEFPWDSQETFYRALKTALLLADYVSEVPEEMICERYEVAPGDIYSAVTNVSWLVHAAARLAGMFRAEFERCAAELELCVAHGVRRELLPLIRLRGIGRVRARRLYTNGITDPDALRGAGRDEIARILGRGIADQVFAQLDGPGESVSEEMAGTRQASLHQFG
jgi:helicase